MEDLKEPPDGLVVSLLPTQTRKVIRPSEGSVYVQGQAGERIVFGVLGRSQITIGVYLFFRC